MNLGAAGEQAAAFNIGKLQTGMVTEGHWAAGAANHVATVNRVVSRAQLNMLVDAAGTDGGLHGELQFAVVGRLKGPRAVRGFAVGRMALAIPRPCVAAKWPAEEVAAECL
jgi:hypothetical protein